MKLHNIYIVILTSFTILFSSCDEKIDIEIPGGEPKLVVQSEVSNEVDSSYVKLNLTVNYYTASPIPEVTNATVDVNGSV
jgi:hypothetical protein